MGKAISNKNVINAKFDTVDFDGKWLASFGRPELRGSWLVWGGSGSGKTTFVLQLCKYLSGFAKVAYNSLEQGLSLSFQTAWQRVEMGDVGSNIILLDKKSIVDLKARLKRRGAPQIVVIDSLMCLVGFTRKEYVALLAEFPSVLFVFISHEKNRLPDPSIAEVVRRLSDIKIHVEGYVAYTTTRYEVAERYEGGADYTIWEQGAAEYKAKLTTKTIQDESE